MKQNLKILELKQDLDNLDGSCLTNVSLKSLSTMKVGGPTAILFYPKHLEDLNLALQKIQNRNIPWMVIGNLSNTIFSDQGYPGCLICLKKMNQFTFEENRLTAEAGAMWSTLCKATAEKGFGGLEFTCGIPGTVGVGIRINAGAHGHEISNVLTHVKTCAANGDIQNYITKELNFAYRSSKLLESKEIVLEATFQLSPRPTNEIRKEMDSMLQKRGQTQPINYPSSGSIFKNPPGYKASQLIEQCGLKGLRIGDAQISEKHANFIINTGQATFDDVLELISHIEETIAQKHSFKLEREVELIE